MPPSKTHKWIPVRGMRDAYACARCGAAFTRFERQRQPVRRYFGTLDLLKWAGADWTRGQEKVPTCG